MSTPAIGTGYSVSGAMGISNKPKTPGVSDAEQDFLNYMKQTPAQRMEDLWLRQHGLTREQFEALGPAEKQRLMNQMKHDIEEQIKQSTENKLSNKNIAFL